MPTTSGVGDTHTLDVESMGPDGTLHRLLY